MQNRPAWATYTELCCLVWRCPRYACCCLLLKELWGEFGGNSDDTRQHNKWIDKGVVRRPLDHVDCEIACYITCRSLCPSNCIIIVLARLYTCSVNARPEASSARCHNRTVLAWNGCGQCKRSICDGKISKSWCGRSNSVDSCRGEGESTCLHHTSRHGVWAH